MFVLSTERVKLQDVIMCRDSLFTFLGVVVGVMNFFVFGKFVFRLKLMWQYCCSTAILMFYKSSLKDFAVQRRGTTMVVCSAVNRTRFIARSGVHSRV